MKKRLEAELISIAHRILKLKNKSEVDELYRETQKLYQALSVLKFYGDNYETLKSDIPEAEIEEKIATILDKEEEKPIEVILPISETSKEEIVEENNEEETEEEPIIVGEIIIPEDEIDDDVVEEEVEDESFEDNDTLQDEDKEDHEGTLKETLFTPAFELSTDDEIEEEISTVTEDDIKTDIEPEIKHIAKQMTLEEILGDEFKDPIFVKPNEVSQEKSVPVFENKEEFKFEEKETKVVSLNDSMYKSITVSLNDRVAFVKHLFNESDEDYNRVLSQLNTFDTFDEAKTFINEMVVPDYHYWIGKEEYQHRFMEIVEKKFV